MSKEMEDMMETFGKPVQKAITDLSVQMTKESFMRFWNDFKRILATASDIYFRKDMGERYYSAESLIGGIFIWLVGTALSTFTGSILILVTFGSPIGGVLVLAGWVTGAILVLFQYILGTENILKIRRFRSEGLAYHSRSRGVPRWGNNNYVIMATAVILLIICNFPCAILLMASLSMSAKLAEEQDAAIYGRYLDALDAQIEKEYLKKAILGQCPVEITQLSRPLPLSMSDELRENMASAAVGGPVTIVAKPREPANVPPQP